MVICTKEVVFMRKEVYIMPITTGSFIEYLIILVGPFGLLALFATLMMYNFTQSKGIVVHAVYSLFMVIDLFTIATAARFFFNLH